MKNLFLIYLISIIFYFLLPFLSYLYQSIQWYKDRKSIFKLKKIPKLSYKDLREKNEGPFMVYGYIDGIEKDYIWIATDDVTIKVRVKDENVFFIPEIDSKTLSYIPAEKTKFTTPFPISEGIGSFVAGKISYESDEPIFESARETKLKIFFYAGQRKNLLRDAIVSSRKPISIFRFFHPAPLLLGILLNFLILYVQRTNIVFYLPFYLAGTAALFPLAIYIPPGVGLVFYSDKYIRKLRELLIEKDLSRFFNEKVERPFKRERLLLFLAFLVVAGLIINLVIIYFSLLILF